MKEVTILGKGPTRTECPYEGEIWTVNDSYDFAKRIDKLFLTDGWNEFDIGALKGAQQKFNCEIVSAIPHPDLQVTLYPIEEILTRFRSKFFTNTICYMLAYALYLGYERIWFYGIDMLTHTCYIMEKGGVEYWMGVANGMGVEIINTKNSATGKTSSGKLYGDWGERTEMIKEIAKGL